MTTEERFIIGLYNQEEQSLVDLYDCYFTLLWSISFRVVADKAICEEVLRQVFQDAWTNPSDFNNGKNYLFNRMLFIKTGFTYITKVFLNLLISIPKSLLLSFST